MIIKQLLIIMFTIWSHIFYACFISTLLIELNEFNLIELIELIAIAENDLPI